MATKPMDYNVICELVEKYNHKKKISNKDKKALWHTISNDYNDTSSWTNGAGRIILLLSRRLWRVYRWGSIPAKTYATLSVCSI